MDETTKRSPTLTLLAKSNNNGGTAEKLKDLLERVASVCKEVGDLNALTRLAELQERLAEERFHLAVLGQFKRGKSTLLNALLGEPLLPTGVVPLTSVPTFLRAGKTRAVRVFFHDRRQTTVSDLTLQQASDLLARHVTEKENPGNLLGVERVEVEHLSSLLGAGVVLIDTPGIGSTLRHNTEATLHFLPQCDAALFVVSADPPITEVEKEFLAIVQGKVAKLCFVMNKIDYLNGSELNEAMGFFEQTLGELGYQKNGPLFKVSAKQGIDARVKEEPSLWRESGLEALQDYLLDFFSKGKSRTLQLALAKKAMAVVADALMSVRLQQRALQLSQRELQKRIEIFDAKVKEIDQEKIKMGDLLAGDRKRTAQLLEDLAETLRQDARRCLRRVMDGAFQNDENPLRTEQRARAQIAEEIPTLFAGQLASVNNQIESVLGEALGPHQERLETLINAIRSAAAELFDIPYHGTADNGTMPKLHKPYWVTQKWNTSVSPVPEGFLDRFLPAELRKHRLRKRLEEEVETLVIHNVENIRWATLRNLDDAFRGFASMLDARLKETAEATLGAARAANLRHKDNEDTVQPELKRLEHRATELGTLENTVAQFADSL